MPADVIEAVRSMGEMRLRDIFQDSHHDKLFREQAVNEVRSDVVDKVWSSYPSVEPTVITEEFNRWCKTIFRNLLFETSKQCDGRDFTYSNCSGVKAKNFMLHYEFPPYATGEGAKASSARIKWGSFMVTVCADSMALMDVGVLVSKPTARVAIGLVTKYENNATRHLEDYCILTDILGIEDCMGDMDMKVAGTRRGFTAIHADFKAPGIPLNVVMEKLQKATDGKTKILDTVLAVVNLEKFAGPQLNV
uniref:Uncharacterized protein n=1 Tax=Glossina palpalis gambiensis TaxID=67801 RepID=A0A1B0BK60_9MUSC